MQPSETARYQGFVKEEHRSAHIFGDVFGEKMVDRVVAIFGLHIILNSSSGLLGLDLLHNSTIHLIHSLKRVIPTYHMLLNR